MTTVVATTTEKMTTIVTCSPKSHSKTYWQRQLIRVMGIASVIFVILYVPTLKTQGLKNGFGRGTQIRGSDIAILRSHFDLNRIDKKQERNPAHCSAGFLYWTLVFQDVYNIYPDGHR
ncbi:hypothetical protein BG004_003007 [Podila humilis]|nr:hypothetical protein BG004_003007 [Podila humilis]